MSEHTESALLADAKALREMAAQILSGASKGKALFLRAAEACETVDALGPLLESVCPSGWQSENLLIEARSLIRKHTEP